MRFDVLQICPTMISGVGSQQYEVVTNDDGAVIEVRGCTHPDEGICMYYMIFFRNGWFSLILALVFKLYDYIGLRQIFHNDRCMY